MQKSAASPVGNPWATGRTGGRSSVIVAKGPFRGVPIENLFLIGAVGSVTVAVVFAAWSVGMAEELPLRYSAHALPAVISTMSHGLPWDFTAYEGITQIGELSALPHLRHRVRCPVCLVLRNTSAVHRRSMEETPNDISCQACLSTRR